MSSKFSLLAAGSLFKITETIKQHLTIKAETCQSSKTCYHTNTNSVTFSLLRKELNLQLHIIQESIVRLHNLYNVWLDNVALEPGTP